MRVPIASSFSAQALIDSAASVLGGEEFLPRHVLGLQFWFHEWNFL